MSARMRRMSLVISVVLCIIAATETTTEAAAFAPPSPFRTAVNSAVRPLTSTLSDHRETSEAATTTTTAAAKSSTNNSGRRRAPLVPPKSLQEILTHQGGETTEELYDQSIQKTYGRFPLTVKYGKGCFLYGTNGMEYLDCVSGIATCALGHANTALQQAVEEQMQQVHHVSNLYYIPQQAVLADWLVQNTFPPTSTTKDNDETLRPQVFFCNSGVEANEAAMKLARRRLSVKSGDGAITKPVIITATNSFHGRTITAISASGQRKYHTIVDKTSDSVRRDATNGFGYDGKMVPGFRFVPFNDVKALRQAVQEICETDGMGLAAVMMEALQGEGGMHPGQAEYFQAIRDVCDEQDALMICDEVQVGMGRSGKLWGWQNVLSKGQTPDIVASAKALGGGVPLGAMIATGRALNVVQDVSGKTVPVWGPGDHASTYGGNPLACRAGLAVAQYYCEHDILSNVQARGEQLGAGLQALVKKYPQVLQEMRGWGLMRGVQVAAATDNNDEVVIPPTRMVQTALDEGLLIVAAGAKVVRFVPPLIITEEQVDMALERFERAVVKIMAQEKEALNLE